MFDSHPALPSCPAHLPLQLLSLQAGWPSVVSSLLLHPGDTVDLQPDGRELSADGTSRPRLLLSVRRSAAPGATPGQPAPMAAAAPELDAQAQHVQLHQQQQQYQPARHASIPLVRSFPAVKVEAAAATGAGAGAQLPAAEQASKAAVPGSHILPQKALLPAPVVPQAATAAHNQRLQQLAQPEQQQQHQRPPSQHKAGTEYWH